MEQVSILKIIKMLHLGQINAKTTVQIQQESQSKKWKLRILHIRRLVLRIYQTWMIYKAYSTSYLQTLTKSKLSKTMNKHKLFILLFLENIISKQGKVFKLKRLLTKYIAISTNMQRSSLLRRTLFHPVLFNLTQTKLIL